VHPHEHVLLARDVALDERDVVLVVDQRAVADRDEVAEGGRQPVSTTRSTSFSCGGGRRPGRRR
jgi:hypothetical protein